MSDNIVLKKPTVAVTTSSLGTGTSIPVFVSGGREILFKTISGGGIIEVSTLPDNTIVISSISITNVSSLGSGVSLIQNVSSNKEINFKSLVTSVYISPFSSGNTLNFTLNNVSQITDASGNTSEPLLYTFSTARSSSKLTLETTTVILARAGTFGANSFVLNSNITNPNARLVLPYNGRIIRMTGSITSNVTSQKSVSIIINNTEITNVLTFPVTTGRTYSVNNNLNLTFTANQGITSIIRGGGGSIANPLFCLWIKFEIS